MCDCHVIVCVGTWKIYSQHIFPALDCKNTAAHVSEVIPRTNTDTLLNSPPDESKACPK